MSLCTRTPGVAHGFASLTDMTITYLVDSYYNPADELGVAWDDPAIGAIVFHIAPRRTPRMPLPSMARSPMKAAECSGHPAPARARAAQHAGGGVPTLRPRQVLESGAICPAAKGSASMRLSSWRAKR